jgi:uncharacterized membrane protein YedE/YeeE
MIFCWVISIICACIGAVVLVGGVLGSTGAPQQAAAAAIAAALVVIPYCFTLAVEGIRRENRDLITQKPADGESVIAAIYARKSTGVGEA